MPRFMGCFGSECKGGIKCSCVREAIGFMISTEVLQNARDDLRERADAIDAAINDGQFADVIQKDFSFGEIKKGLAPEAISNWIAPLLGQETDATAIYRITVDNQAGADLLSQAYMDYKQPNGPALARNNNVDSSTVLYVGSSRKIIQRLQQHLHTCAEGTYALKMKLWCPDAENTVAVEVHLIRRTVDQSLIQDIEDALWKASRPMFGKLGAR